MKQRFIVPAIASLALSIFTFPTGAVTPGTGGTGTGGNSNTGGGNVTTTDETFTGEWEIMP